jgi:hypothetical protein
VCTGLSGEPTANSHLRQWLTATGQKQSKVRNHQRRSGRTGLSSEPPNYPVRHKDRRIQRSTASYSNGRLTWQTPDNKQCHVRCARRQTAAANGYIGGWGNKYPQPPPFKSSKHPYIHIQYKSKESIPRHIQNFQSPQVPQLRPVIISD